MHKQKSSKQLHKESLHKLYLIITHSMKLALFYEKVSLFCTRKHHSAQEGLNMLCPGSQQSLHGCPGNSTSDGLVEHRLRKGKWPNTHTKQLTCSSLGRSSCPFSILLLPKRLGGKKSMSGVADMGIESCFPCLSQTSALAINSSLPIGKWQTFKVVSWSGPDCYLCYSKYHGDYNERGTLTSFEMSNLNYSSCMDLPIQGCSLCGMVWCRTFRANNDTEAQSEMFYKLLTAPRTIPQHVCTSGQGAVVCISPQHIRHLSPATCYMPPGANGQLS